MTSLHFDLADSASQVVEIRSRNRPLPADVEEPLADPVSLFAEAVSAGLFDRAEAGGGAPPPAGEAEVLAHDLSADGLDERWELRLEDIDPAGLRVLASLLLARAPESLSLSNPRPEHGVSAPVARLTAWDTRGYPERDTRLPFPVRAVDPEGRRTRDRALRVALVAPASPEVAAPVIAGLDLWAQLLLCGGYPYPGRHPASSGAMPEPAFQLDAHTIEITFLEAFFCAEAAFEAAVSFAARVDRTLATVESVEIQ